MDLLSNFTVGLSDSNFLHFSHPLIFASVVVSRHSKSPWNLVKFEILHSYSRTMYQHAPMWHLVPNFSIISLKVFQNRFKNLLHISSPCKIQVDTIFLCKNFSNSSKISFLKTDVLSGWKCALTRHRALTCICLYSVKSTGWTN